VIGILGVLLALALLIYFAYRGVSVLILGPVTALLAVLFAPGTSILAIYTQVFMPAAGSFIATYFPLFLLGAVFGKLMEDSGSAQALAQGIVARLGRERSLLAVVLSCAVLTYGGVSLFVVAFAVYPIAAALFREAAIPKRLIPAAIALGAFTFTMTALPGTPAIQNAIPMPYYGTTAFAAPGLGLITGAVMLALGTLWLSRQVAAARARDEGYGPYDDVPRKPGRELREYAQGEAFDIAEIGQEEGGRPEAPSFATAVSPIVVVILLNYLFSMHLIPRWDTTFLSLPQYGGTDIDSVRGIWAIIAALVIAILVQFALDWRRLGQPVRSLDGGANAAVLPIFNTASQVGFGAVIASLPAFALIRDGVLALGGENPLISLAISVNILAGITGSASGGMSIALQTLGHVYVERAEAAGVPLELMHRVTSVATGGLDSLPHNGAVITLLAICGLKHRDSYRDIFVVAVLVPLLALILLIVLGTLFGAF
jgi:H+/gluconate symporter-like permease